MNALTVRQPWAYLLAKGLKPVENRDWRPLWNWCDAVLGEVLALHSSGSMSREDCEMHANLAREFAMPLLEEMVLGCVIATAQLIGFYRGGMGFKREVLIAPGLEVPFELAIASDDFRRFYSPGSWGWVFAHAKAVRPVAAKGHLGLWTFTGRLEEAVAPPGAR